MQSITPLEDYNDPMPIKLLEKYGDISSWILPSTTAFAAFFRGHRYIPIGIAVLSLAQKALLVKLKEVFPKMRPRPYHFGKTSWQDNASFPSSHTAGAFLAVGLSYGLHGASVGTITTLALASLVGLSRYLSQKHWISDISAGAAIGASAGYLTAHLFS
jgi:membrane-associated phospholipid phosphatase